MSQNAKEANSKGLQHSFLSKILKHQNVALFLVFVLYMVGVSLVNPRFLSATNIRNLLVQVSITGVLSMGVMMVIISGGFDLSTGWLMTFLGCFLGFLLRDFGLPPWIGIIIIMVIGMLMETFMGFIISRTGLAPFIISLGFQSIYKSFTYFVTGGMEISLQNKMEWLNQFPMGLSSLAYVFITISIILFFILRYTRFGRRIFAVGGNANAAFLSGIDVKNFKMFIFTLNGLFISICSCMAVARVNSSSPSMSTGMDIDAIAACVVGGTSMNGGKGNVIGVFIGVLLLGSIKNSMTIMGINPYYADLLKGIIIVGAVVLSNFNGINTKIKKMRSDKIELVTAKK